MADGGTLFLDEIGEMPLNLQVKLLRFMETGEFRRVGDNRLRRVDVRIISATNRNLIEEVEAGRFRKDLYYRLSGMVLHLPPLRERKEDILPLAEYFLQTKVKPGRGGGKIELAPEAKKALLNYSFPGNVRELAHLMERGLILAEKNIIRPQNLWPDYREKQVDALHMLTIANDEDKSLSSLTKVEQNEDLESYPTLAEIEKNHILLTLKKVGGNKAQAARLLGISVRNLYRKIEEYVDN